MKCLERLAPQIVALWVSGSLPACSPAHWHAADAVAPVPSALHGDLRCMPGEADCNVCAENVAAQFAAADWSEGAAEWNFREFQELHHVTPDQAYHRSLLDHVQGFVRLNSPRLRYAMMHSGGWNPRLGRFASLSLIVQGSNGANWLTDLRPIDADDGHTSGLFTLGRYVGMFTWKNRLALLDVASGLDAPLVEYSVLQGPASQEEQDFDGLGLSTRSGGVAMVRLAEGGYLLVANEGGDGPSSGHSHFFQVTGDLSSLQGGAAQHPLSVVQIGEYDYPADPPGPIDYHHSENLAILTECGTGDLYTVHVGSSFVPFDRDLKLQLRPPRTFWRVSRIVISAGISPRGWTAQLEKIGVYTRTSTFERCFGRAAGSAFTQSDHHIEVSCHERSHPLGGTPVWNFWQHLSAATLLPAADRGSVSSPRLCSPTTPCPLPAL